jgi:hypothetical protein
MLSGSLWDLEDVVRENTTRYIDEVGPDTTSYLFGLLADEMDRLRGC